MRNYTTFFFIEYNLKKKKIVFRKMQLVSGFSLFKRFTISILRLSQTLNTRKGKNRKNLTMR